MGLDHLLEPVLLDVLAQHLLKVSKKSSSTRSAGGARARQHCLCTGDCTGGCTGGVWRPVYLVVLCERADKDDGGDLACEIPLGPLHPLAAHVDDAELGLAILEVKRLDGTRGVAHLEDVLGRPACAARRLRWATLGLARPPGGIGAFARTHAQWHAQWHTRTPSRSLGSVESLLQQQQPAVPIWEAGVARLGAALL